MCQAVWIERDLAAFSSCPTESHSWDSTAFSPWPSMFTLRGPASMDQLPQWLRSSNTWLKLKSPYRIKCFSRTRTLSDKRCIQSVNPLVLFNISLLHLPVYCLLVFIKRSHLISSSWFLIFFFLPASFPPIPPLNGVKAISITVKLYTRVQITPAVSSNEWLDIIERGCLVSSPRRRDPPASRRKGDNWQTYNPLPPHGTPGNRRSDKVMTRGKSIKFNCGKTAAEGRSADGEWHLHYRKWFRKRVAYCQSPFRSNHLDLDPRRASFAVC